MTASGVRPRALTSLDDVVFDAQCSADAQATNTADMLERFQAIFADGQVDDRDTEHVLYLFRHARLENHWNEEQCSALTAARTYTNQVVRLVGDYRTRLQRSKKAALQSGLGT